MNRAQKENVKFKILCISDSCSGREEWTGLLSEVNYNWFIEGLCGERCEECEGEGCDECNDGYHEPTLMASIYEGTLKDLRCAQNSGAHSSHYLSENCKELCLGDFV